MFSERWQLGIDIQPLQVCAVAISHVRNTWQLQRWWRFLLPEGAVKKGRLYDQNAIKHILTQLRKQIPANTQIYFALSSQIIVQKVMTLSAENLSPAVQHRLLEAQAAKLLMMKKQDVACDFSPMRGSTTNWLMTAVRQQDIDQWLTPFYQTKLRITAVDIQPLVLQRMAMLCDRYSTALYIHFSRETVLWLRYKQNGEFPHFGECVRQGAFMRQIADCRVQAAISDDVPHYICGMINDNETSPFPRLPIDDHKMPLPQNYVEWVLATGLAMTKRVAPWQRR